MREWWLQRAPREQFILGAGALALVGLLFFLLVWEPLYKAFAREEAALRDARELTAWLTEIRPRVQTSGAAQSAQSTGRSLLAVVDSSAKQRGLGAHLQRIQPEGDTTVRVWLENAPLSGMLEWIRDLHQQHSIKTTNLNMDRGAQPGTTTARLTLERP